MNINQMQCLSLGGQPAAVAKLQAAKPMPAPTPIISFGGMQQLCSLGVNHSVLVGRIGGVNPPEAKQ